MGRPITIDIKSMTRVEKNAYEKKKYYERKARRATQRARAAEGGLVKVCMKCGVERPLDDAHYRRAPRTKDGFAFTCNTCAYMPFASDPASRKKRNDYGFKRERGYTRDERDALLAAQGYCTICRSWRHLVVDHCHVNRKIRGVLCNECNAGMGKFDDNPDLLEAAAAYLRASKHHRSGERRCVKKRREMATALRIHLSAAA